MMRKLILALSAFLLLLNHAPLKAQDQAAPKDEPKADQPKRCVKKFKSITDTYYGFPNIFGMIFRSAAVELVKGASGIETKVIGPTGAKYEFMLTDIFGIGTDINYSNVSVAFNKKQNDTLTYNYKLSSPAFRSMLSLNFHKVKPKIDWYTSLKVGYYHRSIKLESNDPGFKSPNLDWLMWPVSARLEFGLRYFPTRFVGMHFNMGFLGGALFNAGVSSTF